jgi:hypothetical protein
LKVYLWLQLYVVVVRKIFEASYVRCEKRLEVERCLVAVSICILRLQVVLSPSVAILLFVKRYYHF